MIVGIGVDAVDIHRFNRWKTYSVQSVLKMFSLNEILYCRKNPLKSAERFAARFAAKEALFKALWDKNVYKKIPFRTFCSLVEIAHNPQHAPFFIVQWEQILKNPESPIPFIHVSLTHTDTISIAYVMVSL